MNKIDNAEVSNKGKKEKLPTKLCSNCTHKAALPSGHPCKKCHVNSRWKRMTESQIRHAAEAQKALESK